MGVILAVLAALEGHLERLRLVLGRLEGILDRLGGILGRLGGVLGPLGGLELLYRGGTVAGTQRAPIRILHDFPDIIRNIIRNIRNDMRKEIRIRILLGYGTLYAMRRHKAWRGGSKAPQAASPPPRLTCDLSFKNLQN